MSVDSHAVENWVKQLSENDMPVFSGTVSDVTAAVNNEKSSAVDVAKAVLSDASLTSRLLKMANTVYFNPSKQHITTVSRAVMVIGFNKVRDIALSLVLVDNLSNGQHKEKLVEEMAHAFHAATQAQDLAKMLKSSETEDIFVATLLSNLGNMAFWAFSEDKGTELLEHLNDDVEHSEIESKVLGFSLHDLTKALTKSWSLGELLEDYLNDRLTDKRTNFIKHGKKLAKATEQGWQSEQAIEAIEDIADELDIDVEALEQEFFNNARKAIEISSMYGSVEASKKIPKPNFTLYDTEAATEKAEETQIEETSVAENKAEETIDNDKYPAFDPATQISIMQEISNTIQEGPSIGIVLEMVLEGLHRGVGMDRAVFVMLTPKRNYLQCKYAVGYNTESLYDDLEIDVRPKENIFHKIIESQQPMIIPGDPKQLAEKGTIAKTTLRELGTPPYMVMPTIVKGKVIGLFIADRKVSGRELTEQDFIAFQQFCMQANMGLSFLAT